MRYFYLLRVILLGCFLFFSCVNEDDGSSSIPYASVDIDIQTQIENEFNIPLHYGIYPKQGHSGVIVITNETATWLYAYDLCCPYDMNTTVIASNEISVECPKCKSTYDLLSGGRVSSGPSTERLKSYPVYKEGNFYRVRN